MVAAQPWQDAGHTATTAILHTKAGGLLQSRAELEPGDVLMADLL